MSKWLKSKTCKLCGLTSDYVSKGLCAGCYREQYGKVTPDSCDRCGGFGLFPECPDCGDIAV